MGLIDNELQTTFKSDQQRAAVNLMYTANCLKSVHSQLLKPHGISVEQFNILRILHGSKDQNLKMSDVRNRMIDNSPNTTRLMDRLVEKGAVARSRSESDRRVVYVQITAKGSELIDSLNTITSPLFDIVNTSLSNAQAKKLNDVLETLRENLTKVLEWHEI